MSKLLEIAPDLLKIISDIVGKAIFPNLTFEKSVYVGFCNYGTEQYTIWYANGNKFEFIHYLDKGQMNLVLPLEKVGKCIVIMNYNKTKYCILSPLNGLNKPAKDVTPQGYNVDKYRIEINPEDSTIFVHNKAYLLGPNGTPSYNAEKLGESLSFPWRNDIHAIASRLADDVRD